MSTDKPVDRLYPDAVPRVDSLAGLYPAHRLREQAARWEALGQSLVRTLRGRPGAPGPDAVGSRLRYYSAPGRTELGGNHTDHNHGRVLAAAVDLDCIAAVHPREDLRVRIESEGYEPFDIDLGDLEPRAAERGTTAALVRGVARWLADLHVARGRGALRGFEARIHSEVLSGSGLSSSAAVEVLFGTILSDLAGLEISPVEIARMGQFAENRFFDKPCGLMDQTASAVGGVVAIDFADPENPVVERIDYDFGSRGLSLVVVNTGGSHADLTPDYASIPAEMKSVAAVFGRPWLRGIGEAELAARAAEVRERCGDRAFLRAWHFAGENGRAAAMAEALHDDRLGDYLTLAAGSGGSSWKYLQNLHPEGRPGEQGPGVALALAEGFLAGTVPPRDGTGREAGQPGADRERDADDGPRPGVPEARGACRIHGGGFAGTIQAYVPTDRLAAFRALLEPVFGTGSVIPISVRPVGAAILSTKAPGGAPR